MSNESETVVSVDVTSLLMEMSSSLFTTEPSIGGAALTPAPAPAPGPPSKSFSDDAFEKTSITLYTFIGLVSTFGVLSNIANIVVYAKQNIKESTTTISFTSLAITDLGICLSTCAAFICYFINYEHPRHYIDVNTVRRLCIYARIAFSEMSMFTTVFLSVERCLCVVKPLTFKKIITKTRTVVILCLLYLEVIVFYTLFFANMPYVWKFDGRRNMTRFTTITTEEYDAIQDIHTYTNGFFVPIVLVSLVTISTGFMIFGLWRASKFRSKSSAGIGEDGKEKSFSIPPKEAKLVKIVIYLLVIFIITYFFVFAIDIIDKTKTEIEFNLFLTLWTVAHLIAAINASANAVVYYNMSSRYKQIFLSTFCKHVKAGEGKSGSKAASKYTATTGASSGVST